MKPVNVSTRDFGYVTINADFIESCYLSTKDGEYPYAKVVMRSGDVYWVTADSKHRIDVALKSSELAREPE